MNDQGWEFPTGAYRAHYFVDQDGDLVSLCGHWRWSGGRLMPDSHPSPDDCKACRAKLDERRTGSGYYRDRTGKVAHRGGCGFADAAGAARWAWADRFETDAALLEWLDRHPESKIRPCAYCLAPQRAQSRSKPRKGTVGLIRPGTRHERLLGDSGEA